MALYDRAKGLAEFCLQFGGKAFTDYSIPILFGYVFFHLAQRTAFVARHNGPGARAGHSISAALFAWGAPEAEIRRLAAAGESPFQWKQSRDREDAIFLAEVVKRPDPLRGGNGRSPLPKLFHQCIARWPGWEKKKIFTFRNGFLVELEPEAIARLLGK